MSSYYELKTDAIKLLELRGHKILDIDWQEYRSNNYGGFYTGNNAPNRAYAYCDYCKMDVAIDLHPRGDELKMRGDAFLNDCIAKNMTKDETGISAITYNNCHVCGKQLNGDANIARGYHTACIKNELKLVVDKNNKFKALSKLPRYSASKYYPVLCHVLVTVKSNLMVCTMTNLEDRKTVTINNVRGDCNICVPRDTFIDIMQLLNHDDVVFSQDDNICTMFVTTKDSKIKINGIDAQEFPSL